MHTNRNRKQANETATPQPSVLGRKLLACAVSSILVISTPLEGGVAYAEDSDTSTTGDASTASGSNSTTSATKDEIVYAKANASGQNQGIYVVNYFNTTDAEDVADPGTYTKLTNLSTTQGLTETNGSVDLTTLANEPFYYQGDLDSSTTLPWTIQLTYTLDGQVVSPDDLAGKDGDLDIDLKITPLDDSSSTSDFANSFMLQAQGTFANANFDITDSTDATATVVGDNTLLTYLVLPGEGGEYHIKGKASDFTYSGWQISAMPITLNVDLSTYDTSELTDQVSTLTDGVDQLADGGNSLTSGLDTLDSGAASAASGSNTLASGTSSLASGASTLASGSTTLASGSSTLASGSSSVSKGAASLRAALTDTGHDSQGNPTTFYSGVSDVSTGAAQVSAGVDTLVSQLTAASSAIDKITPTMNDISSKMSAMEGDAQGYGTSLEKHAAAANDDATKLQNALNQLDTDKLDSTMDHEKTQLGNAGSSLASAGTDLGSVSSSLTSAGTDLSSVATQIKTLKDAGTIDEATYQKLMSSINSTSSDITSAGTSATNAGTSVSSAGTNVKTAGTDLATTATMLSALSTISDTSTDLATQLQGVKDDLTNISTIPGASQTIMDEANQLMTASQSTIDSLTSAETQKKLAELKTGSATLSTGASALKAELEANGAIYEGVSELDSGASSVASGASSVASGASSVASGASTLDSGASQVDSGASTLSDGLDTLASGTDSALSGSTELSDGLDTLQSSVDGLDQTVLDKAQDYIDQKLGKDYQLHSFVDASNTNVNEVEFVYVVDGVTADDSSTDDTATTTTDDTTDTSNQSIVDRFLALFTGDSSKQD
ncbi:MAG: hypothetical protein LKG13_07685 [Atopobiaceae bacterium]|jgi:putative membrane protein|nr:hypothetical protein [Atopobiaceae bacterium]MCH4214227.1 hypothetical protein [Atopobiaceae bacterium]MCH4230385.1 hypothetical protein [Atopobiaceae bacterium]MCI1226646.1 hypothetical protein [Atopobiaceae bacterium]MCI1260529.1 hypothetical protein [Atopobiaceae bacterium]